MNYKIEFLETSLVLKKIYQFAKSGNLDYNLFIYSSNIIK